MKNNVSKYAYRIEWSEKDGVRVARCLEFPSLHTHGDTIEAAVREIEFVAAETIRWLEEEGEPVHEPPGMKKFRGHITLRIAPEMHRELAIRSAEEGVSLNQLIASKL